MIEHPVFKQGEKVRLKSGWGGQMTVQHIADDGSVHIQWDTRIRENDPTVFKPEELELVSPKKSFWQ